MSHESPKWRGCEQPQAIERKFKDLYKVIRKIQRIIVVNLSKVNAILCGGKVIFIARFMPGLRTPVYFSAGKLHVPAWKMLLFDGLAALLSAPALMLAGFYFWNHLESVWKWAKQGQLGAVGVLVVVAGVYFGFKYWRHKTKLAREAAQDAATKPIKSGSKSLGKCA